MTVKTEVQHTGEFLISEGPGTISRESGTLKSGEVVKDGTVLADDGTGKLVASEGASGEDIVGISYGAYDASAAAMPIAYIARLAEVDTDLVTAKDVSGAVVDWDALKALNIIGR